MEMEPGVECGDLKPVAAGCLFFSLKIAGDF